MRRILGPESSLVALDSILSELGTAGDSLAMAEQVLGPPTSFLERSHGCRYTPQLRDRRWVTPSAS
jgi:hypothetical protein